VRLPGRPLAFHAAKSGQLAASTSFHLKVRVCSLCLAASSTTSRQRHDAGVDRSVIIVHDWTIKGCYRPWVSRVTDVRNTMVFRKVNAFASCKCVAHAGHGAKTMYMQRDLRQCHMDSGKEVQVVGSGRLFADDTSPLGGML